jgi:hypothetical protein
MTRFLCRGTHGIPINGTLGEELQAKDNVYKLPKGRWLAFNGREWNVLLDF